MKNNSNPYEQAYFPPKPNGFTKFMRTCVIWQIIRFIAINLKMMKVISKSH
ncbi:MAG: hypothetical protein U9Q20_08290 [Campylobacterota bacterium]|nr:hypothetical protein [Campylobacterota bacterium]